MHTPFRGFPAFWPREKPAGRATYWASWPEISPSLGLDRWRAFAVCWKASRWICFRLVDPDALWICNRFLWGFVVVWKGSERGLIFHNIAALAEHAELDRNLNLFRALVASCLKTNENIKSIWQARKDQNIHAHLLFWYISKLQDLPHLQSFLDIAWHS